MNWLDAHSGAIAGLSSLLLTLITAYYVYLTWKLLRETQSARAEAKRPELAVYMRPSDVGMSFLVLCIENIGAGAACDIRLSTNFDFRGDHHTPLRQVGPFSRGISYFAPRQRLDHFLTGVIDILDELKTQPLEIIARYKSTSGDEFIQSFVLDFGEFENLTRLGDPPLQAIASGVKKLQEEIQRLATGVSKPVILTESLEDHLARRQSDSLVASLRRLSAEDRQEVTKLVKEKARQARQTQQPDGGSKNA
jgi:hypothetical protein